MVTIQKMEVKDRLKFWKCNRCGQWKVDEDLRLIWDSTNKRYYYRCKSCDKNWRNNCPIKSKQKAKKTNSIIKKKKRELWLNFLTEHNKNYCIVCLYSDCPEALDYHHLDNNKKKFGIARFFCRSFNKKNKDLLLKELKKCVTLCKVCHYELHYNYGVFSQ